MGIAKRKQPNHTFWSVFKLVKGVTYRRDDNRA
nr:MAG TPA: hypothetical protein [Caudoviricetes sp.]